MYRKVDLEQCSREMQKMLVPEIGVKLMTEKAAIEPLKFFRVRSPAANIIKQEMLSLGGECATEPGAITCAGKYVDIILLGTVGQYKRLIGKLQLMEGWFGLNTIIKELDSYLNRGSLLTIFADGRTLHYEKMKIMGIINITPDSFYAGSRVDQGDSLLCRAEKMLKDGADILDIGGESTRPGSEAVSCEEEMSRVVPAIKQLKKAFPQAVISIDTRNSQSAKEAFLAGADIINDVSAGEADPAMLPLAAESKSPIILMHMRGTPQTMGEKTGYKNVVDQVAEYLAERMAACQALGINNDKLILDPGIGFAKNAEENLELLRQLSAFTGYGVPVLLGASRKRTIGEVLGNLPAEERLEGTLATSCRAVFSGVNIVRVHDVRENFRTIRMLEAML
ncbi:MAG: dihydropteroate synthase [Acidaminococcaceae bacterium]|jgi:dihydropteroate synthase|nr:dihydropteroate synthase [Acidaminococcaceae bacterium]